MSIDLLGVPRAKKYSPNHVNNDEAIFSLTADALQKKGCRITMCSEGEFLQQNTLPQEHIFTMARHKDVVSKLQLLELQGKVVMNSGFGIEQCYRSNMTELLISNNIPYPKSFTVPTTHDVADVFDQLPGRGWWIKRGDFHALHKEDVTFVASPKEGQEVLTEYASRGIADVVISEHLVGDLVKFYGVRETDFFFLFYPYDHNHHKYADYQQINGKSNYHTFDRSELRSVADAAAKALGVHIYGGDAIISPSGDFHIIDLNDWPSFAPCRQEAAGHIADVLFRAFTDDLKLDSSTALLNDLHL